MYLSILAEQWVKRKPMKYALALQIQFENVIKLRGV
jgi:hypothetical protein